MHLLLALLVLLLALLALVALAGGAPFGSVLTEERGTGTLTRNEMMFLKCSTGTTPAADLCNP
jgi:hypothetical protein